MAILPEGANMKKFSLLMILSLVFVTSFTCMLFAEENNQDMYTGPGVGLVQDNTVGKIYSYGSIITGSDKLKGEVAANAGEVAPVYKDNTVAMPIDNSTINMGPTSANNNQYIGHSLNNGGPGVGLVQDQIGIEYVYGVGPGIDIIKEKYVDPGPTAVYQNADPADFYKNFGITIEEAAALFVGSNAEEKK